MCNNSVTRPQAIKIEGAVNDFEPIEVPQLRRKLEHADKSTQKSSDNEEF